MIFVSYSWVDASYVRILERGLLESRVSLWVDYRRITPDLPIEPQIWHAIERSQAVIFLDSGRARSSRWVRLERRIAREYSKPQMKWQPTTCNIEFMRRRLENPGIFFRD